MMLVSLPFVKAEFVKCERLWRCVDAVKKLEDVEESNEGC
jgi:hypothetical protein